MVLVGPRSIHWTFHARDKMRFYRLSEARVKRVIHSPKRVEEGVAPNTVAMMQPTVVKRFMDHGSRIDGSAFAQVFDSEVFDHEAQTESAQTRGAAAGKQEKWTQEIWVMIQKGSGVKSQGSRVKVISAWRYPGMSKPRSEVLKNVMRQEYEESLLDEKR